MVGNSGLPVLSVRTLSWLLALLVLLVAAECGGSTSPSGPAPSDPTPNPNRITITNAGVSPVEMVVPLGATVSFVNNDSRPHNMASDPHPDHTDCPPLNLVGTLVPGQSRETGNLVVARTCGFHDHDNPANDALRGRIVIR
jgi:plastocyanin